MFNKGDKVYLNELGKRALGNEKYIPNPCDEKLLAGEALEISNVVPVLEAALEEPSSSHFSLHFYNGSYSYSEDFFELAK